jgi:hypothetical protein
MSYCRIDGSWHWFILVESGKYDKCNTFYPDGKTVVAFSYVPRQTNEYINKKYEGKPDFHFFEQKEDSDLTTLSGYIFFYFTESYVLDTWKLTDKYTIVKSRPVCKWSYKRFPEFNRYNIFSFFPYYGITDCIGYSNYHFQACESKPAKVVSPSDKRQVSDKRIYLAKKNKFVCVSGLSK